MPRLAGKTLPAAKTALTRAHCTVGKISKAYSAKVKKGRVMKQSPAAGQKRADKAKVNITLSRGKRP